MTREVKQVPLAEFIAAIETALEWDIDSTSSMYASVLRYTDPEMNEHVITPDILGASDGELAVFVVRMDELTKAEGGT